MKEKIDLKRTKLWLLVNRTSGNMYVEVTRADARQTARMYPEIYKLVELPLTAQQQRVLASATRQG